jgi:hypothetical protein
LKWGLATVPHILGCARSPVNEEKNIVAQVPINAVLVHTDFKFPIARLLRWDEKAGLRGMRYAPNVRRAQGTMKRRPAMKKTSRAPG